jgi:hypothetical protein
MPISDLLKGPVLVKRQEYNYSDEIMFNSRSNKDKVNYPVNNFFVFENIDANKLLQQIELHAIDFKCKTVEKLIIIFVSFHSLYDFENFNNEIIFDKSFDIIDSKNIQYF